MGCLLALQAVRATHIVGGEIYYECIGGDEYVVTLKLYRDCSPNNSNGTGFDISAPIGVYNSSGTLINTYNLPLPNPTQVPVIINNPCLQSPPNICVEEAIYTGIFNLPPIAGGYDLVYQRCCRNPSVVNITNSQDYGATYLTHVPGPNEATCNSSPFFSNYPPLVLCIGDNFTFDHSATDLDGDSLVYELCTPYNGGSSMNPAPNPPLPPPYGNVAWNMGYSVVNQIDANPALAIDPQTGELTAVPLQQGLYVVGVCVKEYRNGVLLSENKRDFQFTVTNCQSSIVASIPAQASFCDGLTANFFNTSVNANDYFWDFGDPNTDADTSHLFNPSYTYLDSGTFTVMLIANPGWPCADTAYTDFTVYPEIEAYFNPQAGQCLQGNQFLFEGLGQYGGNAEFYWDFGPNANPSSSTSPNPAVNYNSEGTYMVHLTISENGCSATYQDSLTVFPMPEPYFTIPAQTGCVPMEVTFQDSSFAWTNISYEWDFGDGNTSTEASPTHVYQYVGSYDVSLNITTDSGCAITVQYDLPNAIEVNPIPTAGFDVTPRRTSIFTPRVSVTSSATNGAVDVEYFMGDGQRIDDWNFEYLYQDTGYHTITQVVYNQHGCPDTSRIVVRIDPEFTFFAPNAFTPDGDGLNDVFHPQVRGIKTYELRIYDRWGGLVFQTNDQDQAWDGVASGKGGQPVIGIYVYQAIIRDANLKDHHIIGSVTLIR